MLYRGIEMTDETVCHWCQKFTQDYANQIRKRRWKPVDKWHLSEVLVITLVSAFEGYSCGNMSLLLRQRLNFDRA